MPPKVRYTREEIADKAYELVRKHGLEILSARSLAAELGTSTAPIFTAFANIEEVQNVCIDRAKALYTSYLRDGLNQPIPFKGAGIKYVEFAKDEPELFKLLFMGEDDSEEYSHFFPAEDENNTAVLNTVKSNYSLADEKAKRLYNHLSVYTHGLAVIYAQRRCVFTMEDVSRMLTEIFNALSKE